MAGMDIELGYLFTIITGQKLRNSFVKRIVPDTVSGTMVSVIPLI